MAIRINPAVRQIWRSPTELQFGYPAQLTLSDVDGSAERLIAAFERGVSEREIESQAAALGVSASEISALIARLRPLIIPADFSKSELELKFSDLMRAALVAENDPEALIANRANRTVYLNRLGRCGLTTAHGLLASGLKAVISDDAAAARSAEANPVKVLKDLNRSAVREVDFAILQGDELVEPWVYQRWLANDIAHIAISFDEQGVTISPVVIPGLTPCLACQSLELSERDAAWSAIAIQLSLRPRDLADAASAIFAAGVTTHRALAYLDELAQLRTGTDFSGLRLTNSGEVVRLSYPQTNCGCRLDAAG